uniref:Uncharacterized protein n=1 Tax=Nelumbo nucifera TaxID=4432 RepID=A0A822ZKX0_NELNU|nr:TPA_asm: hypothetical protein HUJ06_003380 [Nelumbo nucifera]
MGHGSRVCMSGWVGTTFGKSQKIHSRRFFYVANANTNAAKDLEYNNNNE